MLECLDWPGRNSMSVKKIRAEELNPGDADLEAGWTMRSRQWFLSRVFNAEAETSLTGYIGASLVTAMTHGS